MATWLEAQTAKRETAASKNELESYIISTRESLETDELLMKVRNQEAMSASSWHWSDSLP